MAKKEIKSYSLSEMKDNHIGKVGTKERDLYEYELQMDLLGRMIRTARLERKLTQEQLGELIGVQKSQISKLESSANSATIDTIIKVFKALKAEIHFNVKLEIDYTEMKIVSMEMELLHGGYFGYIGNCMEIKENKERHWV